MTPVEQLVEILRSHARVMSARELANALGRKHGDIETRRRLIRHWVKIARPDSKRNIGAGHKICADAHGYWLARSHREWSEYLDALKRGARFTFVKVRDMREAATDRDNEQGTLFEPSAEPDRAAAWARDR